VVGCQAENNCYSQTAQFSFPDCNFCPVQRFCCEPADSGRTCLCRKMERLAGLEVSHGPVVPCPILHQQEDFQGKQGAPDLAQQPVNFPALWAPSWDKTIIDRDHLLKLSENWRSRFMKRFHAFSPSDAVTRRYAGQVESRCCRATSM